jgi:hypothetical protein
VIQDASKYSVISLAGHKPSDLESSNCFAISTLSSLASIENREILRKYLYASELDLFPRVSVVVRTAFSESQNAVTNRDANRFARKKFGEYTGGNFSFLN